MGKTNATKTPAADKSANKTPAAPVVTPPAPANVVSTQTAPESAAPPSPVVSGKPRHADPKIAAVLEKAGPDGSNKLSKDDAAILRAANLNKKGEPIKRGGKREAVVIDPRKLAGAVEFGGKEAVDKLFAQHGDALRKPFKSFARSFVKGTPERVSADALFESYFPTKRGGGAGGGNFKAKGFVTVGKSKRGALLMSHLDVKKGDRVKPISVDGANIDQVLADLRAHLSSGGKAIVLTKLDPSATISADVPQPSSDEPSFA